MSALIERLRAEGGKRCHDRHRYHVLMHEGRLTREQLQQWVLNRYYYQTRIRDHDGDEDRNNGADGGLAMWLRLANGVGLDREEVASCRSVLPGVRAACDSYVELVRSRSLVEAVASSLTEFFAPELMGKRVAAWEKHYPWIDPGVLTYWRARVTRERQDSTEAVNFVERHATTAELQDRCVDALIKKTEILWKLLDSVYAAYVKPKLAPKAKLRYDRKADRMMLLYPEKGLVLNPTAADTVKLCTGEYTVGQIAIELSRKYKNETAQIERGVISLVGSLAERGLMQE